MWPRPSTTPAGRERPPSVGWPSRKPPAGTPKPSSSCVHQRPPTGGDFPHRRTLAEEAIAMARRLGDPETLVRVLNLLFFCLCVPETLVQRLETTAESVSIADRLTDPALQHWSHRYRVYACAEAGDADGIDAHLPVVEARAAEVGDPSLAWAATFIRGGRATLAGALA